MTDALKPLRDALEAGPTDGPWKKSSVAEVMVGRMRLCSVNSAAKLGIGDDVKRANINAAYIAAANPATIRALLARLDAAEADARRYRWLRDQSRAPEGLHGQILEALRDGLSVCMSVSVSRDRKVVRDDVTLYAQTEEWCRWLDSEVGPKIRSAVDALSSAPTAPQSSVEKTEANDAAV